MEETPTRRFKKLKLRKKKKFYEKEGSLRTITSGSLRLVFSLASAVFVWILTIIGTSWPGLKFFGLTTALSGLVGVFNIGFSRYFTIEIKQAFTIHEDLGKIKASSYSKIILFIGIIISIILIIIGLTLQNPLLKFSFIGASISTFLSYINTVFSLGIEIKNRYDILSFINVFSGIFFFFTTIFLLTFDFSPQLVAFYPIVNVIPLLFYIYYFSKIAPYEYKDIFLGELTSKSMINVADEEIKGLLKEDQLWGFIKNSALTVVTNLESSGIFRNLLVLFAALYLAIITPATQGLSISILTILLAYGAVKSVVVYYSAPLNLEIAEARVKKKKSVIEESINDSVRISSYLALGILIGLIFLSGYILRFLHGEFFIKNASFDYALFNSTRLLFIFIIIGEFAYSYSTLFGNALIGSGHPRFASIGFGITLGIIVIAAPFVIAIFNLLGVGILMVGSAFFVLPYLALQLKHQLQIKYHFRITRLIPSLIIISIIFIFFPVYNTGTLLLCMLVAGIVYIFLNPFFGVSLPRDILLTKEILSTLKLKSAGTVFSYILVKIYNLSPLNKEKIIINEIEEK
ncbi:MAG: hypothetical protein P8Y70_03775 [Candidatus Lokiarchaeota archaeon]